MQGRLFAESKRGTRRSDKLTRVLAKYDTETFEERLERLRYVTEIYPHGLMMLLDQESAIVFGEAKMAFINGEFAATTLLAQAFIERRFQRMLKAAGNKKVANASMKAMIDQLRSEGEIPAFVLERIDLIRRKRNPFVHLKEADHEYNLDRRMITAYRENRESDIVTIMLNDARESLAMMYTVAARMGNPILLS